MAISMIGPKFYAWDDEGNPLKGGRVYTYRAGTNAPKATWQEEEQVNENPNPVILNDAGYADIYLDGSYKIRVTDSTGTEIWTEDPVTDPGRLWNEWASEIPANQYGATQFEVPGDQAALFVEESRVRLTDAATLYGSVVDAQLISGNTRVTVSVDSGASLTNALTFVELANITPSSVARLNKGTQYRDTIEQVTGITPASLADGQVFDISTGAGEGKWRVTKADISSEVTNDPLGGIYRPWDGEDGSTGGVVRFGFESIAPEFFGAVNSDSVSSSDAFQAAINYAPTGSTIKSKSQKYLIDTQVDISGKSGVTVDFNGAVVNALPNGDTYMFAISGCTDIEIRNGYFDGHVDEDNTNRPSVFSASSSARISFKNNTFDNVYAGCVALDDGGECNDFSFNGNKLFASIVYNGSNDNQLSTLLAYGFGVSRRWRVQSNEVLRSNHLVLSPKGVNWNVSGNICRNTNDSAIYLRGAGHVVDGNTVIRAGKDAIKILESIGLGNGDNVISNNYIDGSGLIKSDGGVGIEVAVPSNVITGNRIKSFAVSTLPTPGVKGVLARTSANIISDNIILSDSDVASDGVFIQSNSACNDNLVQGNSISNHANGVSLLQSGNTLNQCFLTANKITSCGVGVYTTSSSKSDLNGLTVEGNDFVSCANVLRSAGSGDGLTGLIAKNNRISGASSCFPLDNCGADCLVQGNHTDGSESNFVSGSAVVSMVGNLSAQAPISDRLVSVSEEVVIPDDGVYSFNSIYQNVIVTIIATGEPAAAGQMAAELIGAASVVSLCGGVKFATSTAILNGTSGVDGNLTVSANGGAVYIENRLGASKTVKYLVSGY